jgi:hypothetical protein
MTLADTLDAHGAVPAPARRIASGRRGDSRREPSGGSFAIPTLWWALLVVGIARTFIS